MNIIQAVDDERLFRPWFRNRASWSAWRVFLSALFGLPLDHRQLETYQLHTGRDEAPTVASEEAWLCCGRRAGKSLNLALVGIFLSCFREYREYLAPGEKATCALIAADRKQARQIFRYMGGMLTNIPMLKAMVQRETAEGFDLNNSVTIEIGTASYRTTRGYSYCGVLVDEIAFLRGNDSANPDSEILAALRPGLVSIPGAMLLCASSPHSRRGELFDAYRRFWGREDQPLFWQAASRAMNPTISERTVSVALERDEARARAEFLAEFRRDVEAFLTREAVEAVVEPGVLERPRNRDYQYRAFCDPSGGSADSMTMAIGHAEKDKVVLDVMRERRPPFSPEAVVDDFAGLCKSYGVFEIHGDRYGGDWPREQFRKRGINYKVADKSKSDLYRDLLPKINSGQIDLLDHPKLLNQLVGLERRVARGGRESIDHSPGSHDDVANAAAGLAAIVSPQRRITPPAFQTHARYT